MSTITANPNPFLLLGEDVSGESDLQKMLERGGAGFVAEKRPVQVTMADGRVITSDEYSAIVRTDTDEILATHSGKYTLQPYADTLRVANEIVNINRADGGTAKIEHVGTFDNGRKFFVNVFLGTRYVDPSGINDRIDPYISGYSSHDGVLANFWREGNLRYSCNNILPVLRTGNLVEGYYVKHTKNMPTHAERAMSALLNLDGQVDEYFRQITQMLKIAATPTSVEQLSRTLWPKVGDSKRSKTMNADRLETIMQLFKVEVDRVGSNGWALYNAFTEWKDHHATGGATKRAVASVMPQSNAENFKQKVGALVLAKG